MESPSEKLGRYVYPTHSDKTYHEKPVLLTPTQN